MGQSAAQIGKGTIIGYGADGVSPAGSYTPFLEVKKVTTPKITTAKVKCTHFLSPNAMHEYVSGWGDGGDATFEANYINADRTTLLGMRGVYHWFQITYPNTTTTEQFRGFITDVDTDIPNEDIISTKVTIKVTSTITYNA